MSEWMEEAREDVAKFFAVRELPGARTAFLHVLTLSSSGRAFCVLDSCRLRCTVDPGLG